MAFGAVGAGSRATDTKWRVRLASAMKKGEQRLSLFFNLPGPLSPDERTCLDGAQAAKRWATAFQSTSFQKPPR